MAAGSHDHKASPVFLKQYNFWQNSTWEVGNNVQPNCCKILVGARSCASAWDGVCREMWKGCSCWCSRECPAERAKLSCCSWLCGTGCCHGSSAHSCCCMYRMFSGTYSSGTASSPFPVSVCVPERDYLCLISSLAALHSLLLHSSSLEIFIGKALTAQTSFLQGGLLYRLLQACLLRKFSCWVFQFCKVFI